eukprot:10775995-Karenia_brevis.AAC.1
MDHVPAFIAYIDVGGVLCQTRRQYHHDPNQWSVPEACLKAISQLHQAGGHLVLISRGNAVHDRAWATARARTAHWEVCYELGIDPRP